MSGRRTDNSTMAPRGGRKTPIEKNRVDPNPQQPAHQREAEAKTNRSIGSPSAEQPRSAVLSCGWCNRESSLHFSSHQRMEHLRCGTTSRRPATRGEEENPPLSREELQLTNRHISYIAHLAHRSRDDNIERRNATIKARTKRTGQNQIL